jgi:inhibitor of cysteine peptidase
MRRLLALAVITVLGLGVVACGDDSETEASEATGDIIEFTDDSETIAVTAGEEFAIRLESNPSTGYSWALTEPLDDSIVVSKGSDFEQGSNDAPGAGGHEVLTYEAVGDGTTTIDLGYLRSFEDAPPTETKKFTVEVTG